MIYTELMHARGYICPWQSANQVCQWRSWFMSAVRPRAGCRDEIVEALFTLRAALTRRAHSRSELHRARDSVVVVNARACAKVKAECRETAKGERQPLTAHSVWLFNGEKNYPQTNTGARRQRHRSPANRTAQIEVVKPNSGGNDIL